MGIMRVDLADTKIKEAGPVAGRSKSIMDMGIMRIDFVHTFVEKTDRSSSLT